MPIEDVFQTPYQAAPLDLLTDAFYETRKEAIETRLEEIWQGQVKDRLILSYNTHYGTSCLGVAWESYSLEELYKVVCALGGPALATIFRIFCEDYKHSRSGMPDLILWRTDPNGGTEHQLVEVKSSRDRLSDAQRHWAWIFAQNGINMLVCKVKHSALQPEGRDCA